MNTLELRKLGKENGHSNCYISECIMMFGSDAWILLSKKPGFSVGE